jgi:hypothetical protein
VCIGVCVCVCVCIMSVYLRVYTRPLCHLLNPRKHSYRLFSEYCSHGTLRKLIEWGEIHGDAQIRSFIAQVNAMTGFEPPKGLSARAVLATTRTPVSDFFLLKSHFLFSCCSVYSTSMSTISFIVTSKARTFSSTTSSDSKLPTSDRLSGWATEVLDGCYKSVLHCPATELMHTR